MRGLRGFALLAATIASAAGQSVQLADGVFKVAGWHADASRKDWSAIFSVYAGAGDLPAMLGVYSVEAGVLEFRPRFPLTPGIRYHAVLRLPGTAPIEAWFDGPRRSAEPATRVERIYPSVSVWPANLLKLYIVFSAPMSRGEAFKRIRLLDDAGRPVKGAFLEIDQELWDPELRRLTVLFDPGRIKRDLVPNLQNGVPIQEGREYTITVDREFTDARGMPLADAFRKHFRGGPADRTPPDPATWRVHPPLSKSRDALVVRFPKPLDYALLLRTLDVSGVRGTVAVGRDEIEWTFTPAEPWKTGAYKLSIDTTLEDLAGNRIGRAFDRNEGDRSRAPEGKISLPFEIR